MKDLNGRCYRGGADIRSCQHVTVRQCRVTCDEFSPLSDGLAKLE